ncbi:MAG TPA: glycosyltransferase family 1 protein [Pyrinomonadaceae bacterium]|jgi:alpha-1,3-rhamnosyl/mannosyltransferase|nr:glycosyltransferase family 1 protein [Pyrinomonadaceae bacterium]
MGMLIGLDAIPLTEPLTGVGHYTLELARALASASPADDFALAYPSRYPAISLPGAATPPNLRAERVAVGAAGRRWWLVGLPRHARAARLSLFHGTNYEIPLRAPCPTVLTIHDLSAFSRPRTHLPRRALRQRLRLSVMARAATEIITPTEAVRREVLGLFTTVDPEKVTAIHEAPREIFRPLPRAEAGATLRRLGVEGDFVLAVGTVEPRKNLATLLRAFEGFSRSRDETGGGDGRSRPVTLVVAGREGWLTRDLRARVEASPARGRVRFTGYVSDEDLRALYSSCLAFVYPSLYEGFGLPPVEAMSCGACVVASRVAAHSEVLGEEAALLVAPGDAAGFERALTSLAADETLRRSLSEAGRRRAAQFTWGRAARETLEVYRRALEKWSARRR